MNMARVKRCAICYGLTENEIKKLKLYGSGVQQMSSNMKSMKIQDIIEVDDGICTPEEHKIVLFNEYPESEVRASVKKIRQSVPGVILAMVTSVSKDWTFENLLEQLLEERKFEQKGGK